MDQMHGIGCARPFLLITLVSAVSLVMVVLTTVLLIFLLAALRQLSELCKLNVCLNIERYEIMGEVYMSTDKKVSKARS